MDFTEEQIKRYARHIILPEVGGVGQDRLLRSSVLVIGAGGLGSPLILYLAAAGVGRLGIVDDDDVDLTNLQRQIIHGMASLGRPKVESARDAVLAINPGIQVEIHRLRLNAGNALPLFAGYDVIADGSDNLPTRFLVNDAARLAGKPLVSGAVLRFEGQLATFKVPGPCYRCLYHDIPPDDATPSCAQAGVLGAMAGVVGSMQATEILKELLGIGDSLSGWLLRINALSMTFRKVRLKRDPACPLCGDHPVLHGLSAYQETRSLCG